MRIGLFTDTYPPEINGVANSTYILRTQLEKMGHEVYVITTNSSGKVASHWEDDGHTLRLKGAELKFLYGYVATSPFHFLALQEIRKLNLDIIHDQTEFGVGIFAHICAMQLGIPLVSTYHTTYEDYTHYVNFIHSRTVDSYAKKGVAKVSRLYGDASISVIAPSQKTKDMLIGYHIRRDIDVIPTGLDLDEFHPSLHDARKTAEIREKFGFSADDTVIVSVGRIAQEKSLDVVMQGFANAVKAGLSVKMLIAGDGPDFGRMKQMAADLDLEKDIVLAGAVPRKDIPSLYRACDLFASASLSETQGMTFIEALASGLPLLVRYDDVLQDLVSEGEDGWFFKDPDDFVTKLKVFLSLSKEQKAKMTASSLKHVEPYSARIFGEKVYAVYEKAIEMYHDVSTIDDVQVKDSFVQLYLINGRKEELRLQVTMDDYANLGLRKGGTIANTTVKHLQEKEAGVRAYQGCVRRIAIKDRTRKEVYDWLSQETPCDITTINKIVEKLESRGYIDDERYCRDAVHSMRASLMGTDRIVRSLMNKGLPAALVHQVIGEEPDTSMEDCMLAAQKMAGSMKHDSIRKMKYTLSGKLVQRGFTREQAERAIASLDLGRQEEREMDNLKHCAAKAKRRYQSKYSGTMLRNRVFRYCAAQGYDGDDIYAVMDGMEWNQDD
ncbi:MAG: RecX family transcriptional regulator [Lactimicrobium massiliense]|nr:RecX family transcriptional regulator [Lactimicrobium massiliense]MDD6560880.1 RecX family transcriptional regulator [Lactimicrobium massiliense]